MAFVELSALSNFTFLHGASHPEEVMARACDMGMAGVAVADVNSVAGIVRAHAKARELARLAAEEGRDWPGTRLIPAARIVLRNGFAVTCLPEDRAGWGRLCRLISLGRLRVGKGECDLGPDDLLEWGAGMVLLIHPPAYGRMEAWRGWWRGWFRALRGRVSC